MTDNSPAMGNEWLLTEGTSTSVSWGSNCSGNGYGFSFGDASFYGSEEGVKMTYPSWPWGAGDHEKNYGIDKERVRCFERLDRSK